MFDEDVDQDALRERDQEREPTTPRVRAQPQLRARGTLRTLCEARGIVDHSQEWHEALKADAHRWTELPVVGSQAYEPEPEDEWPAYRLQFRNCTCGSTLALEVAL